MCFCWTATKPSSWKREKARDTVSSLRPEVGADLVAGHAQVELGGRETPRREALGHVEQEGRQPFLGAHRAEQHHHAVVAHDLAAHDLVELVLQALHLAGELLEPAEGDHADLAVFKGDGVARVVPGADAVQAQHFAGHLEAGDLVAPVLKDHVGLEGPGADRVDRLEGVAPEAVEVLLALDLASGPPTSSSSRSTSLGSRPKRQAQLPQVALEQAVLISRGVTGITDFICTGNLPDEEA